MLELDKGKLWTQFIKLKISQRELERRSGLNWRTINRVMHTGYILPQHVQKLADGLEMEALDMFKHKGWPV